MSVSVLLWPQEGLDYSSQKTVGGLELLTLPVAVKKKTPLSPLRLLTMNAHCSPPLFKGVPLSKAWRLEQRHYLQMWGGCVCVCVSNRKRDWSAGGCLERVRAVASAAMARKLQHNPTKHHGSLIATQPQYSLMLLKRVSRAMTSLWPNASDSQEQREMMWVWIWSHFSRQNFPICQLWRFCVTDQSRARLDRSYMFRVSHKVMYIYSTRPSVCVCVCVSDKEKGDGAMFIFLFAALQYFLCCPHL